MKIDYRISLLLIIVFLFSAWSSAQGVVGNEVGNEAPEFMLPNTDNESITLSDHRGSEKTWYSSSIAASSDRTAGRNSWGCRNIIRLSGTRRRTYAISVDAPAVSKAFFVEVEGVQFPILSDQS